VAATLEKDILEDFYPTERINGKTIIRVRPRATRAHRMHAAGAVQIGRLRPIGPAEGNLGSYPCPWQ
jgi:hypothetical protein